jgi:hypothetical protein
MDTKEIQKFSRRLDELRQEVKLLDPRILARNTSCELQSKDDGSIIFRLKYWDSNVDIPYQSLEATRANDIKVLPLIDQTMLMYYFSCASGNRMSGRWISFAELPDGRFYNQAFQGYTGQALYRHFGDQGKRFKAAAERLNGTLFPLGDASYIFRALPCVPLLVVFWQGDEDFSSSYQLLFDAVASEYLPTDAYAILGSGLTRRLIKANST